MATNQRAGLAGVPALTIEQELSLVVDRAHGDAEFAARLGADPVAALLEVGCAAMAGEVRRENERIRQLAVRLDEDGGFRALVEDNPTAIVESGIPREALESVLRALGASDEVLARAREGATLDATASVLGALAFTREALADSDRPATGLGPVRRPIAIPAVLQTEQTGRSPT